jgi:hypothetical protein
LHLKTDLISWVKFLVRLKAGKEEQSSLFCFISSVANMKFSAIFVRLFIVYEKTASFIAIGVAAFSSGLPASVAGRPHG